MTGTLLDELSQLAGSLTADDRSQVLKLVKRAHRVDRHGSNLALRGELVAQLLAGILTDLSARTNRADDLADVLATTEALVTFLMVRVRSIIAEGETVR